MSARVVTKKRLALAVVAVVALAAGVTAFAYFTSSGSGLRERQRGHGNGAGAANALRAEQHGRPELDGERQRPRNDHLPRRAQHVAGYDLE